VETQFKHEMDATSTSENIAQDATKFNRAVPVKEQFANFISCWVSLDLQQTEEIGIEDPFPDSSSAAECNQNEESKMPPPVPCFDRHARAQRPAPMLMQGNLSRVKSASHLCGAPASITLLQRKGMTQSMPNLHSSRSMYNRGIGYSMLSSATECGGQSGKHAMRARVEEFDALLEDL
jgi:hypothetical protein